MCVLLTARLGVGHDRASRPDRPTRWRPTPPEGQGVGQGAEPQELKAPVVPVDDIVLADLLMVADGLLRHGLMLGGPVPPPEPDQHTAHGWCSLVLEPAAAAAAAAAGALTVVDAEAIPVVHLGDVVISAEVQEGLDAVQGRARLAAGRSTGPGHGLRLSARPLPDSTAEATVVVLGRPLLEGDERALADRVRQGRIVVLVVPVAGSSPDGLGIKVMLRLAEAAAARTGAVVVTATLAWRDPVSDENLCQHVAAGLGAGELLTPGLSARRDQPGEAAWVRMLDEHRRDVEPGPELDPVDRSVLEELRRWRPPASRRGLVVLMTGLSGSGKSTLARALAEHVEATSARQVSLLDGDHVRRMLSAGLGFDRRDRELNVLRIGYVATEVARHGGMAVCAPIAPYARTREQVRAMVQEVGDLVLVHVSTPLAECERRDLKGLYARARAGEIPAFTGISDPYEEPDDADVVVDTSQLDPHAALTAVTDYLRAGQWLAPEGEPWTR